MKAIAPLLALLLVGSGCAPHTVVGPITGKNITLANDKDFHAYRLELNAQYVNEHPGIDPEIVEAIYSRKMIVGMSKSDFLHAWSYMDRRGRLHYILPQTINKDVGPWGIHEQWVMRSDYSQPIEYIYFENDVLTSWQSSNH